MSDQGPISFHCPSCGAPLTPPRDGQASMTCPFCSNSLVVPPDLRDPLLEAETSQARKKEILRELMRLLGAEEKLPAIKVYRECFDATLEEAKEAIESLEEGRGIVLPEPVRPLRRASQPPVRPAAEYSRREAEEAAARESARLAAHRQADAARRRRQSCGGIVSILSLLMVSIVAGAALLFQVQPESQTALATLMPQITAPVINLREPPSMLGPGALLSNEDADPDVVTQGRRYDTDPYQDSLMRISTADGKVLWETAPFPEDTYLDELISDGERVYAVIDNDLTAYQAADGKQAWQARLSDKLGYCGQGSACLRVVGDVLLVQSMDNTLQAYDAASGQALWNRRVDSSSRGLLVFKNQALVYAQGDGGQKDGYALLDLRSGKEAGRFKPEDAYSSSPLYLDEAGGSLYVTTYYNVEKWDLTASPPQRAWRSADLDFRPGDAGLLGPDTLYLATDHGLAAIRLETGEASVLIDKEDYALTPLAVNGAQLLILAQRTRGSARYELWGVNPTSGERWTIAFDEHKPLDQYSGTITDSDASPWTWQLARGSLVVIHFEIKPNQFVVESYDPQTGVQQKKVTIPAGIDDSDYYYVREVLGWQGSKFWMVVELQIYSIDVEQGKLSFKGP